MTDPSAHAVNPTSPRATAGEIPSRARVVATLLRSNTLRHWRQQPRRTALLVLLVSIGVSVFLSMRLANRAAVSSFTQFAEVLTQQTDAVLIPRAGLLPEAVLEKIREAKRSNEALWGVEEIIPLVETNAALPRTAAEREQGIGSRTAFTLLGVDLVALQNLATSKNLDRSWFSQGNAEGQTAPSDGGVWALLGRTNSVFCAETLAAEEGLQVGSKWSLIFGESTLEFELAGIIPSRPDQPAAPKNLL